MLLLPEIQAPVKSDPYALRFANTTMGRVSYVIGLLPCAIALSSEATPAAKRVAIIG